jgi:hypothetical protein
MRRQMLIHRHFRAMQLFLGTTFVSDDGESSHLKLDSLAATTSMSHEIDPRSLPLNRASFVLASPRQRALLC